MRNGLEYQEILFRKFRNLLHICFRILSGWFITRLSEREYFNKINQRVDGPARITILDWLRLFFITRGDGAFHLLFKLENKFKKLSYNNIRNRREDYRLIGIENYLRCPWGMRW